MNTSTTEFGLGLITGSLPLLRVLLQFIPGVNRTQKGTDMKQSNAWANGSNVPGTKRADKLVGHAECVEGGI